MTSRAGAIALLALLSSGCGPLDSALAALEADVGLGPHQRVHRDVPYGRDPKQRFDAYVPAGSGSLRPLVVAVHPGAWQGDSKSFVDHFADQYTSAGIAVFSIDYRLAPENPWPAQVDDVRQAIRFFRAAGPQLGIDPDRIALLGDSCGGQLALLAALVDDPLAEKPRWSRVRSVVASAPVTDLVAEAAMPDKAFLFPILFGHAPSPAELRDASPVAHVRADVDVLLIHGAFDDDVPVAQSDEFQAALLGAMGDVIYLRRNSAQHIAFKDARINDAVIDWLCART